MSLHCHAVVGRESWLGQMFFEQGHFGYNWLWNQPGSELLKMADDWIQLFQSAIAEGKMRPTDELLADGSARVRLSLMDVRFPRLQRY